MRIAADVGGATPGASGPAPPTLVLDTNAALDLFVFADPAVEPLRRALAADAVQRVATQAMRTEFAHVAASFSGNPRWPAAGAAALRAWDEGCRLVGTPQDLSASGAAPRVPRCSDPDDQMFIDLAIALGARWLVSRDRAVLKLARRLAGFGVAVLPPARWRLDDAVPLGR